ncbi:MAG: tetratricopeptide repeat protein [Bacteroidetes bacterium]|nr:tetratricopeptide repeat protein [Bacteroidota bacterium]
MEYRMIRLLFVLLLFVSFCPVLAQERSLVRKGNALYEKKQYKEAAAAYQEALKQQPQFVPGAFNLGNALLQEKQYDAARKVMDMTAKTAKDPIVQSGAQYNKGNSYMDEQKWQDAVNAYKESLRKNPSDADAKYNLSYALEKLKQQQKQGGGKDQQKDKDKQDEKKQDEKQQPKDDKKQDEDPKEGDKKQQQKQGQQQPGKLTEQQADNILKALQQDERKTQDKMQKSKAQPVKLEKDW